MKARTRRKGAELNRACGGPRVIAKLAFRWDFESVFKAWRASWWPRRPRVASSCFFGIAVEDAEQVIALTTLETDLSRDHAGGDRRVVDVASKFGKAMRIACGTGGRASANFLPLLHCLPASRAVLPEVLKFST